VLASQPSRAAGLCRLASEVCAPHGFFASSTLVQDFFERRQRPASVI
jgi:hypothetical protein